MSLTSGNGPETKALSLDTKGLSSPLENKRGGLAGEGIAPVVADRKSAPGVDEGNVKLLRALATLGENRKCFDCGQPGPTYVNVTVGAYVCTACSGRLRGLIPPHRVKSITMATFTADEIEFIKCRGNEFCRQVWLARYQSVVPPPADDRDKMVAHLGDKYEKQRWYQAPSDTLHDEARRQAAAVLLGGIGGLGGGMGAVRGAGGDVRQSSTMPEICATPTGKMNTSPHSGSTNESEATMVKRPSINRRHAFPCAPASPVVIGQAFAGGSVPIGFAELKGSPGGNGRIAGNITGGGVPPQEPPWTAEFGFATQQVSRAVVEDHAFVANFADFDAHQASLTPPQPSPATFAPWGWPNPRTQSTRGSVSSGSVPPAEWQVAPPVPSDKYAALAEAGNRLSPVVNWDGLSESNNPFGHSISSGSNQFTAAASSVTAAHGRPVATGLNQSDKTGFVATGNVSSSLYGRFIPDQSSSEYHGGGFAYGQPAQTGFQQIQTSSQTVQTGLQYSWAVGTCSQPGVSSIAGGGGLYQVAGPGHPSGVSDGTGWAPGVGGASAVASYNQMLNPFFNEATPRPGGNPFL